MRAPIPEPRFTPVEVVYTNHAGITAKRRIIPVRVRFAACPPWHPEPQWLLYAQDVDRQVYREFAMAGFHGWGAPAVGTAELARSAVQLAAMLSLAAGAAHDLLALAEEADRSTPVLTALEILADALAASAPPPATDGVTP